jgi:hypothetical protein
MRQLLTLVAVLSLLLLMQRYKCGQVSPLPFAIFSVLLVGSSINVWHPQIVGRDFIIAILASAVSVAMYMGVVRLIGHVVSPETQIIPFTMLYCISILLCGLSGGDALSHALGIILFSTIVFATRLFFVLYHGSVFVALQLVINVSIAAFCYLAHRFNLRRLRPLVLSIALAELNADFLVFVVPWEGEAS